MNKKSIVRLTDEERQICREVVKKLKGHAQKVRRANILLMADADGPALKDEEIAEAYLCRVQTVENVRKRCILEGFELALNGKKRETPPTLRKLDGAGEAKLITLSLGPPPSGYARWTLRLLGDRLVELGILESICPETVRKTLKKRHLGTCGAVLGDSPEEDAEFAAAMEDFARPYDAKCSVTRTASQIKGSRELLKEIAAWSTKTNQRQGCLDWHLKNADARIKLARLDPRPLQSLFTPLR